MNRIYFDNNATTPLLPDVLEAMLPYLSGEFGNPSSLHREGRLARRALASSRERIAQLLEAHPDQVLFTSGGTEANNLAILGMAGTPPARLITSSIEHPSVGGCFELLEKRGFELDQLSVDSTGLVDLEDFRCRIKSGVRLASVMLANNETGAIQPVATLADEARRQGVPFHTDAVQAVGRIPVSFRSLGVTSLSLSAHKFHGPIGVGALIVEKSDFLHPVLAGGHQERGFRPGTEPVPLVVGMARALERAIHELEETTSRLQRLQQFFVEGLREHLGSIFLNGPTQDRVPNTVNLRFPELDAQAAVLALDLLGLACSTGSACASGARTPSHTLLAMGLSEEHARSSLRFSFSRLTTQEEVGRAIELVASVVKRRHKVAAISASE